MATRPVREHCHAGLDYLNKLARFLENHTNRGQPRRSQRKLIKPRQLSVFCPPGLHFFHQASSRAERNGFRPTSFEARLSPLI
jgi:hypothetical protein